MSVDVVSRMSCTAAAALRWRGTNRLNNGTCSSQEARQRGVDGGQRGVDSGQSGVDGGQSGVDSGPTGVDGG